MSAIPRAHPRAGHAGLFRPPFAASQRDPESRAESQSALLSLASAARTAALWLLGPLSAAARPRRKKPEGARADARAFAVGTRTCRQRTSGASSRSRLGTM